MKTKQCDSCLQACQWAKHNDPYHNKRGQASKATSLDGISLTYQLYQLSAQVSIIRRMLTCTDNPAGLKQQTTGNECRGNMRATLHTPLQTDAAAVQVTIDIHRSHLER
jgi:hypothetical protein